MTLNRVIEQKNIQIFLMKRTVESDKRFLRKLAWSEVDKIYLFLICPVLLSS
jgi:hypothetical protein